MTSTRSKRIRPQRHNLSHGCNEAIYKIAAKLTKTSVRRNAPRKKKAISLSGGLVYLGSGVLKGAI